MATRRTVRGKLGDTARPLMRARKVPSDCLDHVGGGGGGGVAAGRFEQQAPVGRGRSMSELRTVSISHRRHLMVLSNAHAQRCRSEENIMSSGLWFPELRVSGLFAAISALREARSLLIRRDRDR